MVTVDISPVCGSIDAFLCERQDWPSRMTSCHFDHRKLFTFGSGRRPARQPAQPDSNPKPYLINSVTDAEVLSGPSSGERAGQLTPPIPISAPSQNNDINRGN